MKKYAQKVAREQAKFDGATTQVRLLNDQHSTG
jgi:hypothetical protein